MKRKNVFTLLIVGALMLLFSFVLGVAAQDGMDSNPDRVLIQEASDSNPAGTPEIFIPEKYRPQGNESLLGGGPSVVYFTPQDENTSTTVLFLYNTEDVNQLVTLETFSPSGAIQIGPLDISVPAGELVRLCADEVDTISATWQETLFVNFTTFSAYARLTLPEGVKAEAFVVWNNGNTFDPLDDMNTLNIRFSSDPATVLLPTALNN